MLWWEGPPWLIMDSDNWPHQNITVETIEEEEKEICLVIPVQVQAPVIPLNHYSSFTHLQRITAWILRFVNNCRRSNIILPIVTVEELITADKYWIHVIQENHFSSDIAELKVNCSLSNNSSLLSFCPFIDSDGLLCVGGRECNSGLSYQRMHPFIFHGKHLITKVIIRSKHDRMLHAGSTLLSFSLLLSRFHIIYMRKTVCFIVRQCITCHRYTCKPQYQLLGELPLERVTPGSVFQKVGAGPIKVKYGMIRKPTIVKTTFVCLSLSQSKLST